MTTVKPLTVDNLGIGPSSRYARDQVLLDPKLIEDSRFIPQKTETSVLKPYIQTELEEFLFPNKPSIWAAFSPPPHFFSDGRALFSYQLIPSLGGYEKQEADTDKLAALEDTLNKPFKEGRERQEHEQQEEERERKTLSNLLQTIYRLNRTLTLINSRRNQYQRG